MTINLLPWRQQQLRRRFIQIYLTLALMLGLISLAVLYWHIQLRSQIKDQKNDNIALLQQINSFNTNESFPVLNNRFETVSKQIVLIEAATADRQQFWDEWSLLQRIIPNGLVLNEIRWNHSELQLQGNAEDLKMIAATVKALESCPQLLAVDLQNLSTISQSSLMHFTIKLFYQREKKS
jgi:Tfp pilus assembly protein PilN